MTQVLELLDKKVKVGMIIIGFTGKSRYHAKQMDIVDKEMQS